MTKKRISKEQITRIASLARLEVTDTEKESLEKDLGDILEYVAKLEDISTVGVSATYQVHGVKNIFRDDIRRDSIAVSEVEKIAPDFSGGGFRVPKVI